MTDIRPVRVPGVEPAGHYSPGVVYGGLVHVSGQLPFRPGDPERRLGTVAEQTEQALRNVEGVLRAAGSDLRRVVQMTIYVSDVEHWGTVNEVYARVMGEHRPARAIVPVPALHHGAALEVQATAAVDRDA